MHRDWNTSSCAQLWGGRIVPRYFSSGVTVVVFVLVPQSKLLWESVLNHLIGHLLTHSLETETKIYKSEWEYKADDSETT